MAQPPYIHHTAWPHTAAERGHLLRNLVDASCRSLDGVGLIQIGQYRTELCEALCEVLFGNLPVDVPSWPTPASTAARLPQVPRKATL